MAIQNGDSIALSDPPYGATICQAVDGSWTIDAYRHDSGGQTRSHTQFGWQGTVADAHARLLDMLRDFGYGGTMPLPEPEGLPPE